MENEEKNQEENTPQESEDKKPTTMVESAHQAAEELKKQNEIMQQNISKLEELKAVEMLGGKTDAGEQPEKPKEETPAEYAKKVMKGEI